MTDKKDDKEKKIENIKDKVKKIAEALHEESAVDQEEVPAEELVVEEPVELTNEQNAEAIILRGAYDEKEREVDALKDKLVRIVAENENFRKQAEIRIEEASKYAASNFAKDLIPAIENLFRAIDTVTGEQKESNAELKNVLTGIDMTVAEFLKAFSKHGLERVYPLGAKYDYNFHEAITKIPDETKEEGTIVDVIRAGYTLNGRLIQSAMVAISTKELGSDSR